MASSDSQTFGPSRGETQTWWNARERAGTLIWMLCSHGPQSLHWNRIANLGSGMMVALVSQKLDRGDMFKGCYVVCLCESSFKQLKENIQNANVPTASTTQRITNDHIGALTAFNHDAIRMKKSGVEPLSCSSAAVWSPGFAAHWCFTVISIKRVALSTQMHSACGWNSSLCRLNLYKKHHQRKKPIKTALRFRRNLPDPSWPTGLCPQQD